MGFLEPVTSMWHIEGLNTMSQSDSHTDSLSKACLSTELSFVPIIVRYIAVSSAQRRTFEATFDDRSLM